MTVQQIIDNATHTHSCVLNHYFEIAGGQHTRTLREAGIQASRQRTERARANGDWSGSDDSTFTTFELMAV